MLQARPSCSGKPPGLNVSRHQLQTPWRLVASAHVCPLSPAGACGWDSCVGARWADGSWLAWPWPPRRAVCQGRQPAGPWLEQTRARQGPRPLSVWLSVGLKDGGPGARTKQVCSSSLGGRVTPSCCSGGRHGTLPSPGGAVGVGDVQAGLPPGGGHVRTNRPLLPRAAARRSWLRQPGPKGPHARPAWLGHTGRLKRSCPRALMCHCKACRLAGCGSAAVAPPLRSRGPGWASQARVQLGTAPLRPRPHCEAGASTDRPPGGTVGLGATEGQGHRGWPPQWVSLEPFCHGQQPSGRRHATQGPGGPQIRPT